MAEFSRLPQELVDSIVDEIDGDESLAALSLVATPFVIPCQRRIFETLSLSTDPSFIPFQPSAGAFVRALTLFTAALHLAHYVRNLEIDFSRTDVPVEPDVDTVPALAVINILQNMEALAVRGYMDNGFSPSFHWKLLSPDFLPQLQGILQRPNMRSLHLKYMEDVPQSLVSNAISSLSQLSIDYVGLAQETSAGDGELEDVLEPHDDSTALKHLVVLFLRNGGLLSRRDTRCALRHLQRLELLLSGRDGAFDTRNFLHRQTPRSTLRHLVLRWDYTSQLNSSSEIPLLPALQTLEFISYLPSPVYPSTYSWTASFPFILGQNSLPACVPALEHLTLVVRGRGHSLWSVPTPAPVLPFDTPTYVEHLPRLRRVECHLDDVVVSGSSCDDFFAYMHALFPGPRAAGVLDIYVSYRNLYRARHHLLTPTFGLT
ncbi:hypothetical protein C8R43DRAFT_1230534 [Mycena crocata]|nr:hypothetical protein C8R43DRAFT_1230534 [Mycena crocata]